jgi:hypothetical protein
MIQLELICIDDIWWRTYFILLGLVFLNLGVKNFIEVLKLINLYFPPNPGSFQQLHRQFFNTELFLLNFRDAGDTNASLFHIVLQVPGDLFIFLFTSSSRSSHWTLPFHLSFLSSSVFKTTDCFCSHLCLAELTQYLFLTSDITFYILKRHIGLVL